MKIKSLYKLFVLSTSVGYALFLLYIFALRTLLQNMPPWLTLLSTFEPFLFLPAPLFFFLAWTIRSRFVLALALVPVILFVVGFGAFFIPRRPVAYAGSEKGLTVMTMNLGSGVAIPDRLTDEIEQSDADIVAVQEMTRASERVLANRLREKYPFLILDSRAHTTGLLSRYPIRVIEWFQPANEGRAALYVEIDVNNLPLNVIAPHPLPSDVIWWQDRPPIPIGLDDSGQRRDLADISQRAQAIGHQVIVLGDLNVSDQTRAYPILANQLRDAYREVGFGFGFTFPNGLRVRNLLPINSFFGSLAIPGPWLRLDYVFHSDDLIAESAQVICRGGSDHCYLLARLRLP